MFEAQLSNIWKETLQLLENDLSKPSFDTWFKSTELVAYYGETIIIKTPNEFAKSSLENNYYDLIKKHLENLLNHPIKVKFVTSLEKDLNLNSLNNHSVSDTNNFGSNQTDIIPNKNFTNKSPSHNYSSDEVYEPADNGLNQKYTFDTFVIGNGNRFTHAACLAVAESISKSLTKKKIYNPLFIYGGVGLGKTHLMHAIGHHILMHNRDAKIKYVSSEKFTNELIDGIKDNRTAAFRNKYRKVDVLLIDDIQFLSKKEGTQEEFFHTFNDLYEANKQIIISSDRQPKEIPTLEERLRTRFEWGLITDVQAPDLETRIAILRKKAQMDNLDVGDDVMLYIAENIQSNIRELEGVLIRLAAFSSLNNRDISMELAQECLQNLLPSNAPIIITGELIQQKVAEMYSLKVEDFKARKRTRSVSYPRQIAMYLCRELTDLSLPKIGEIFGGRDHTTVIHAHEKITQELKKDPALKNTLERLKSNINT